MKALSAAVVLLAACPAPAAGLTPNVVILADDLGPGDVQRLNPGRGKITTPHLDIDHLPPGPR